MKETVNRVDAIRGTGKVAAIRPFGFLDGQMYQSQPEKKRMKNSSQDEDKIKDNTCKTDKDGKHIDCNA